MKLLKMQTIVAGGLLAVSVAACSPMTEAEKNASLGPMNVVDETGLDDIMLNLADPEEAVAFFRDSLAQHPDRVDLKRGYAKSLVRAKKYSEAALVFEELVASGEATDEDRLAYAESLVRNGAWEDAKKQLDAIAPTVETFKRYFLEALVADHNKEWEKADRFYDIARGLTTKPAQVLNNWGISKLNRRQYDNADKLFKQAIMADPKLFAAKNNLVLSRAKRRIYELPVMPMTDKERAVLLYNMAREAIKNKDIDIARGLLETAIEVNPQHFAAATSLLGSL